MGKGGIDAISTSVTAIIKFLPSSESMRWPSSSVFAFVGPKHRRLPRQENTKSLPSRRLIKCDWRRRNIFLIPFGASVAPTMGASGASSALRRNTSELTAVPKALLAGSGYMWAVVCLTIWDWEGVRC
jgi:hypothetical protein